MLSETSEVAATGDFPAIAELVTNRRHVPSATLVPDVGRMFFAEPHLDAVAIVDNGSAVGLVTRNKFLFSVFRQFGWEVYQRKTIALLADVNAVMVGHDMPLDRAMAMALERGVGDVYDEMIVVNDDGSFHGLLSVRQMIITQTNTLANITVQKQLAHDRAREAEEVARIKSQFLANVTHELRSPVNAIIELAELMRMAAENGYVEQVRDRLALLMSSATNLRSVITNMLDLSKIEAGRMRVFLEDFDLVPLLQEVADTARVLLAGKPVEVRVASEAPAIPMRSDPVKLRQIVLNLVSNAVKFTDQGEIVIEQRSSPAGLAIAVSDTGIGIRTEDLQKLFVAFSQVEDAHTKHHAGTGLGLAITRELSQMLGGHVTVESTWARGSRFALHFTGEANNA